MWSNARIVNPVRMQDTLKTRVRQVTHAVQFLLQALWRWEAVGIGSTLLYGFGVAAMYGDDYIVADCLYFLGIVWLTTRVLAWEETKGHPQRRGVSVLILLCAVLAFGGSHLWIQHRKFMHMAEKGEPKKEVVAPKVKSDQRPSPPGEVFGTTDPLESKALQISADIMDFLAGREATAPPLPKQETWEHDISMYSGYEQNTLSIYRDIYEPQVNEIRNKFAVERKRTNAQLDAIYEKPPSSEFIRIVAKSLRQLAMSR